MELKQNHIAFVNPPYDRIAPGYEFVRHISNCSPSLGLLHLAAQVRLDGYKPTIIESDVQGYGADDVVERIVSMQPCYVGITLFTVGVWSSANIAKEIKRQLPGCVVIVGGPHISSMGLETMKRFPQFDAAVVGEGETTLSSLLQHLQKGTSPSEVNGLIYREGGEVVRTLPAVAYKSLDELPFPAWDLLPGFPNSYLPAIFDFPQGPVATIAASRGCPFHCRFCDTSTFGAKVRAYSPQKVFEMMCHLQDKYGVTHIMFVDDLFLASKIRVTQLCKLILSHKRNITWSCAARVDTVKPDVLHIMREAGCWEVSFGLETGSDELLKKMDKVADVRKSEQAVKWTDEASIRTKGLFMLGYPGENAETIKQTRDMVRRIPMRIMNLTKFTPYPGSPIYVDLYGTSIREDHWKKMNGMNFVWAPQGMTIAELDKQYQKLLREFYTQPRTLWHFTKMTIHYPNHIVRLMRFLFGFAKMKIISFANGKQGRLLSGYEAPLDSEVTTESNSLVGTSSPDQ